MASVSSPVQERDQIANDLVIDESNETVTFTTTADAATETSLISSIDALPQPFEDFRNDLSDCEPFRPYPPVESPELYITEQTSHPQQPVNMQSCFQSLQSKCVNSEKCSQCDSMVNVLCKTSSPFNPGVFASDMTGAGLSSFGDVCSNVHPSSLSFESNADPNCVFNTNTTFSSHSQPSKCFNCGKTELGSGCRRVQTGGQYSCNACGMSTSRPFPTVAKRKGIKPVSKNNRCANCNTSATSLWRRSLNGETVCNACGLYFKLHNAQRPLSMKKETVMKRKRRPKAVSNESSSKLATPHKCVNPDHTIHCPLSHPSYAPIFNFVPNPETCSATNVGGSIAVNSPNFVCSSEHSPPAPPSLRGPPMLAQMYRTPYSSQAPFQPQSVKPNGFYDGNPNMGASMYPMFANGQFNAPQPSHCGQLCASNAMPPYSKVNPVKSVVSPSTVLVNSPIESCDYLQLGAVPPTSRVIPSAGPPLYSYSSAVSFHIDHFAYQNHNVSSF